MQHNRKTRSKQQKRKPLARLWFGEARTGAALSHRGGERMDIIDTLCYGAVTPGEELDKPDRKQQELGRLIEKNLADLAALHPEAGALLEKLAGNQSELREYETRLAFRSGVRLGMQFAAKALTDQPELYEE